MEVATPDYYLRELTRREGERKTDALVEQAETTRQTKYMLALTLIIGVLTAVNVVVVIASSGADGDGGSTTVVKEVGAERPESKLERIEHESREA